MKANERRKPLFIRLSIQNVIQLTSIDERDIIKSNLSIICQYNQINSITFIRYILMENNLIVPK
jgi:hypothetical protein